MTGRPVLARAVTEVRGDVPFPLWIHPDWTEHFPWLVQGTTGQGDPADPFDLGLSGSSPVGTVLERWRRLADGTGMAAAVHSRQVHRAAVHVHRTAPPPGVLVMDGFDGHAGDVPGLLMTVSVADCVPVSVVSPGRRAAALLHAGWRGVAAGILEAGIAALRDGWRTSPAELWLHCGPAICGTCYEVGPEVHARVHPARAAPAAAAPLDLRAAIAERAAAAGVDPARISLSAHCTRCGVPDFFSHRGGSPARQLGILGIR